MGLEVLLLTKLLVSFRSESDDDGLESDARETGASKISFSRISTLFTRSCLFSDVLRIDTQLHRDEIRAENCSHCCKLALVRDGTSVLAKFVICI